MDKRTLKEQGFYHTPAWRRLRVAVLQRDKYLCQACLRKRPAAFTVATEVHHIKPLEDYPELALDVRNLESLCWRCHEATKVHRAGETKIPEGVRVIRG